MARNVEIRGLEEFVRRLDQAASGELRREFAEWLDGIGAQFLEEVQREIVRTETTDTRNLLLSFNLGDSEGFWEITDGGLTLEVGTNVTYAQYANDGHFQEKRFVPGTWSGGIFRYNPNADTGMMLKTRWIPGTGYWDSALLIFERMFERSLERKLQEWLDTF